MLNFRTASIYLIIFAAAGILLMLLNIQYFWLLIILALAYLYLLIMGSVKICSGFYLDVACKGSTAEKRVALTFDDGPDAIHTAQVLEILEKHQAPATFFIIGRKAEQQEDMVRRIISKGHSLGNHSYSHALLFDLYGRKKMERDLLKTEELLMKISGKKPVLFRPPYGVTNPVVAGVVKRLGYRAVGWSVKSLDTVLKDAGKIAERVTDRLHPGAIILMHDDRKVTAEVLEGIILKTREEGYQFVGLEQILGIDVNDK